MPLINAAYMSMFMWANPLLTTLEEQILVPMFSDAPVEMGMGEYTDEILARLSRDADYQAQLQDGLSRATRIRSRIKNVIYAITSFERTLAVGELAVRQVPGGRHHGDVGRGHPRHGSPFNTEKFDCYHCHAGTTFTTSFQSANTPPPPRDMRNTGLYNIDGKGAYPTDNTGLYDFTQFSATTWASSRCRRLRNVELTAPYFHDGSAATLEEVLRPTRTAAALIASGPYAGDGSTSPHRDPLVKGFDMSRAARRRTWSRS